jgi:hypothetical protein
MIANLYHRISSTFKIVSFLFSHIDLPLYISNTHSSKTVVNSTYTDIMFTQILRLSWSYDIKLQDILHNIFMVRSVLIWNYFLLNTVTSYKIICKFFFFFNSVGKLWKHSIRVWGSITHWGTQWPLSNSNCTCSSPVGCCWNSWSGSGCPGSGGAQQVWMLIASWCDCDQIVLDLLCT